MLRKRLVMGVALLGIALTPLTACSQENQDVINEISSLEYTGDTDKDLRSLCSLSETLTKFSNNNSKVVEDAVTKVADNYAKQSNDEKVDLAADLLKKMTSTDQKLRARGEKDLKKLCASI